LKYHVLLFDYEKSFDKEMRSKLWEIVKSKGYPSQLVNSA